MNNFNTMQKLFTTGMGNVMQPTSNFGTGFNIGSNTGINTGYNTGLGFQNFTQPIT